MIAVDSSVVVTAAIGVRGRREAARGALLVEPSLPSHAALESYAVLTRLPPPFKMSAMDARAFIRSWCAPNLLHLSARGVKSFLAELPELSLLGGTVYDALIGRTAAAASARLLTMDRRALAVYRLVGADADVVGD